MIIEGITSEQFDDIQARIEDGSYAKELCTAVTTRYQTDNARGLTCVTVTASIDSKSITGDINDDAYGVPPFDKLNSITYSGADVLVLIIFLLCCCLGWCLGWYSHKKKVQKELENKLNLATNFQQQQEIDIRKQMAANARTDIFQKAIEYWTS